MGLYLPYVEHVFSQKLPHVREHVKIFYVDKIKLTWRLYKPWTYQNFRVKINSTCAMDAMNEEKVRYVEVAKS
jgi:hypothetical protein